MIENENKEVKVFGNVLACIGGLLVILNFTVFKDSGYNLLLVLSAGIMVALGLIMANGGKLGNVEDD